MRFMLQRVNGRCGKRIRGGVLHSKPKSQFVLHEIYDCHGGEHVDIDLISCKAVWTHR